MAELAEESRARKRGVWAIIVLLMVAAFFAVLFFVARYQNEFKRSSGDNTRSPISANENR